MHLKKSEDDRLKTQAQLEVTEAQRDELRALTEQLKSQAEQINQRHVAEILQHKEREDTLRTEERHMEEAVHAELAEAREKMATLKAENERLTLESTETREGLHRANTEMAELGMTICR